MGLGRFKVGSGAVLSRFGVALGGGGGVRVWVGVG